VDIPSERTRLSLFADELVAKWPDLYGHMMVSPSQFELSAKFGPAHAQAQVQTFVLTQRGPVFIYPVRLPPPVGDTQLEKSLDEMFTVARRLFSQALPGKKCMRIGLVRELIFGTGDCLCHAVAANRAEFAGAHFMGGESLAVYRDSKCNVRVKLSLVQVAKMTQSPLGLSVTEPAGRGMQVEFDVNNAEVRPLEEADIDGILERANSLWPEELIKYINARIGNE
jgi:hypothetical protein